MADRISIRDDRPPASRTRKQRPPEDRKEAKRWYSRKSWLILRRSKLRSTPFCELCIERGEYTPAVDVHHKTDRREDQDLALEMDNLQSLCKRCHSRITGNRMSPRGDASG